MHAYVKSARARGWRSAAALAIIALGAAGCSSEISRFGNPNGNPYSSRSDVTGSVASPDGRIESRPLAAPATASRPTTVAADIASPAGVRNADLYGQAQSKWNWDGGTAVIVAPGETVDTLSRKHGVPVGAILQANNLASAAIIYPGQRIVIPRLSAAARATNGANSQASQTAGSHQHVVASGETLMSISRRYGKPVTEIAAANRISANTMVKIGDRIAIPGQAPDSASSTAVAAMSAPAQKMASIEPQHSVNRVAAAPDTLAEVKSGVEPMGATPTFRWPVRGRVITAFGAKTNGQQNDGINLSVPEGTSIRAAEDGVVAYAGNELKGYGNLVLVRHGSGFVTAYAHASEITVKRGDQVRRGQVIGRSGQTGNVSSPQLHFEIRKGSTPVDPMQHLPGA